MKSYSKNGLFSLLFKLNGPISRLKGTKKQLYYMYIETGLFYNTGLLLCTFNKINLFSVECVLRSIRQVVVALYFKIATPEGFSLFFGNRQETYTRSWQYARLRRFKRFETKKPLYLGVLLVMKHFQFCFFDVVSVATIKSQS